MTTTLDIERGDTVRLRNGEEFLVKDTCTMYHDAKGDHEGPFVSPNGGADWYLVEDVEEVIARNPNRCVLCGGGVTSKDPERYPYCVHCHYTGQVAESLRAEQLAAMTTALDGPTVAVWHTGGGCMMLAVTFDHHDGYYGVTDANAGLPTDDEGNPVEGGWGLLVHYADEEDQEGRVLLDGSDYTDEQVVAAILRDRKGQRVFPKRGTTHIHANNRDFDKATGYRLTVPAALARAVGPDVLFIIEATDEGILFRRAEGSSPRTNETPKWLR